MRDYDDPGYDDYLDEVYEARSHRQQAAIWRRTEPGSPDALEMEDEGEEE